ncbi:MULTISPECIES: hypothetical protein [unclassified Mesorhizobium]|uniref:hypothetical protein n=1 Tax=unclassified Mesorhizobium TaxID=325217 RepID=UPI000FD93889|nr:MULTISPECIES: hypothetical protein [unclassified Mesorhizobium]TGQ34610.1 hypothetical protein EN859_024495 [Mesorhizobium sp. M00.F.Ca.ET.216.01.1.1]TIS54231.1 MAG: hypothetical protein E5W91_27760 [Mesorhizobium sp.]TIS88569.1 MAG: hypothetical protein E5W89_19565 [Mesorhizobium sp.]TJW09311.1 MAG: hypothetical protein E5W82_21445 [Mesorhizobium sp.]TJW35780.1 MAG: hypothetical protein E5W83_34210 [Mesorhizobium sp.]
MAPEVEREENPDAAPELARRDFIKGIGKFAAVTPATVTMLLEVSMNSPAVAASGGKPGWGFGTSNPPHNGPPGLLKKPSRP